MWTPALGRKEIILDNENMLLPILAEATKVPGVRINRNEFLQKSLQKYYSQEQISQAIEKGTYHAGIDIKVLDKIAGNIIAQETLKCTGSSFGLGIPGGFALIGTIPADLAQYYAFSIRVIQKLAYIYGWPDFDLDDVSGESIYYIVLFLGVMSGVGAANSTLKFVSNCLSKQALKKLPQMALTKGIIYPLVKQIAKILGKQMTKEIFAKGVSKAIPIVSGFIAGGLTLAMFQPSCKKLKKQLSLEFGKSYSDEELEKELKSYKIDEENT